MAWTLVYNTVLTKSAKSLCPAQREKISDEIDSAQFRCVLSDGSTDKSITKQEAVYVGYTGPNGRPTTQFADIVALDSAGAVGVTNAIQKGLQHCVK